MSVLISERFKISLDEARDIYDKEDTFKLRKLLKSCTLLADNNSEIIIKTVE